MKDEASNRTDRKEREKKIERYRREREKKIKRYRREKEKERETDRQTQRERETERDREREREREGGDLKTKFLEEKTKLKFPSKKAFDLFNPNPLLKIQVKYLI